MSKDQLWSELRELEKERSAAMREMNDSKVSSLNDQIRNVKRELGI